MSARFDLRDNRPGNLPPNSQLAALEQRLQRMSPPAAPELRRRVLVAVDAALGEPVPAMNAGWPSAVRLSCVDVVAGPCLVSALAAVIAIAVFWAGAVSTSTVPLSLDDRARIAGVSGETLAMPVASGRTTDLALQPSSPAAASARPVILRALDTHRILQETL